MCGGRPPQDGAAGSRSSTRPLVSRQKMSPAPSGLPAGFVEPGAAVTEVLAPRPLGSAVRLGGQLAADAAGRLGRRLRLRARPGQGRGGAGETSAGGPISAWCCRPSLCGGPPLLATGCRRRVWAASLSVWPGGCGILLFLAGRRPLGRRSNAEGKVERVAGPPRENTWSVYATLAVALLLSLVAGAHAAVEASRRDGAIAEAVAARAAVIAELEVAEAPRPARESRSRRTGDRG